MEPALGWRIDPYARHELRYFFEGEPTSWVCTGGKIALETVAPVQQFVAAAVGRPGPAPSSPAPSFAPAIDEGGDGWRMDPFGTHEFRYYERGMPTSWVSTEGDVAEEFVVTTDEFLRSVREDEIPEDTGNGRRNGSLLIEPNGAGGAEAGVSSDRHQFLPLGMAGSLPVATSTEPAPGVVQPAEFRASMDLAASAAPHAVRPGDLRWPRTERPSATHRRRVRRTTIVVACAVGALAAITSLAAYAATSGTDRTPPPKGGRGATAPPLVPTTNATLPIANDATASWWAATGQPDTHALLTDIQAMNGQLGDPTALGASCRTFSADTATASAAPTPPTPSVNREWQQTLSTVTRVVNACAAGNYPRLAEDLQPASLTIDDLGAQVANDLR